MKDKIFGVLQRVGRSFMLPIALLPVAGLLLGIGSSFTNATTLEAYGLTGIIKEGNFLYTIFDIMSKTGSVVFDNLALLFAMGTAIGMAKTEKETAALSGVVAYLIMNTAISVLINANGGVSSMPENSTTQTLGITTLQMGVFGGIIVGLGVAALHNKFYNIKLVQALSFFGGTRFVPIISGLVYLLVGIIMFYVWPVIQTGISHLGSLVLGTGYIGTLIYGIIERALIPFGLHHVFYMPFWQTQLGGTMVIDGTAVSGAQNIFFAQLASKSTEVFSVSATRFMSGKFPFMIFGLPAAALAMYKTAKPEKKKEVGGLLLSASLTSIITGITEPLEFTFLFAAPVVYAVHCVLAGFSYMLMHILNVGVGMTFSGGLIDLVLFGVLQGNAKTNWIRIIFVGIFYAVIYYFVFYFMITKMNLKTPGRESSDEKSKLYTRKDLNKKESSSGKKDDLSEILLKGLGGKENIGDLDCCATRLRVTVKDASLVDKVLLKQTGAGGVIQKGEGVQIVYGPQVAVIKSDLVNYMNDLCEQSNDSEKNPQQLILYSPLNGLTVDLENVEDEVFSQKILGEGMAVEPIEGKLYSPCDGKVISVFDTKHGVNIISNQGAQILLHVGIDTVKLSGKYFHSCVKEDQQVKRGDLLISFDIEEIKREGYKTVTPMVLCGDEEVEIIKKGGEEISAGEPLIKYHI